MIAVLAAAPALSGCSDFFEAEDLVNRNSNNFPDQQQDIESALVSVYAMNVFDQGSNWYSAFMLPEIAVDYTLPAGGPGDRAIRALASFKQSNENELEVMWPRYYTGIHRANFILENIDRIEWDSEKARNKVLGQTYFLRANFYLDLVRVFENVPLITAFDVDPKTPQAKPEEVWQFLLSDFARAIELLPDVPFDSMPKSELGRVTKWAAEGMIARAWMFYTGVYHKDGIKLLDGTVLDKQKIISILDDCIEKSGHALISDFRNLWPYSLVPDYKYNQENGLKWIGESGDNCETVFCYKFSIYGDGKHRFFTNAVQVAYGFRGQGHIPFGQGNALLNVNPKFYEEWPDDDLRKIGTLLNVNDKKEGINYKWNKGRNWLESGFFQKKYMPVNVKGKDGKPVSYTVGLYGASTNRIFNNMQDMVILRFADILLMGAELGGPKAQEYLDRVRARAKLPSIPATLENIKQERLHELCFEGVIYWDRMRWGDLESEINRMKHRIPVKIEGRDETITIRYRPETRGFWPIPQREIDLSNGILKQNEGWTGEDSFYRQ